jgi:integrase
MKPAFLFSAFLLCSALLAAAPVAAKDTSNPPDNPKADGKGPLFRTSRGRTSGLSDKPMAQQDVYRMIGRRAVDAGVRTKICCHSFRATGITEYLRNGGKLEVAQQMANHESARTTGLYDRRNDQVSLDEVERILI